MRILSTFVAIILLFSSANLSIVRHFCGGRVADVQFSILGEASCGMSKSNGVCTSNLSCNNTESLSRIPCCEDELTQLSIADDYKPATANTLPNLSALFIAFHCNHILRYAEGYVTPVRNYKAPPDNIHSVSLSFISVFLV